MISGSYTMKPEAVNEKTLDLSEDQKSGLDEESGVGDAQDEQQIQLSRTLTKKSTIDPLSEPPDGGLDAWLKVVGCCLLYSNIWGFTLSFGQFQNYYQHNLLSSTNPSAISWIGTVQSWLLILVGTISGPLFDLGYFRSMLFIGNFLIIFGIFMLSLSKTYWQVFLSQGVCMGLGAGLLYVPTIGLIGLSFSTKRSLAQGIVTAGIAIGGVSYILSFEHISTSKGFGWAVRSMGFIALGICIISFPALLKGTSALARARTARKLWDSSAFKEPPFLVFTAASLFSNLGYVVPYFYISVYAQDVLGISQEFSLSILMIAIAGSFVGRLTAGTLSLYFGPIFMWFWCAASSGVIILAWMAVESEAGFIAWSAFYGFCSAGLVAIPASVFPSLCNDMKRLGTRLGMSWGITSFACLIGSPIAGALLQQHPTGGHARSRSDFVGPQAFAGCCLLVTSAVIFVLWLLMMKRRGTGIFI